MGYDTQPSMSCLTRSSVVLRNGVKFAVSFLLILLTRSGSVAVAQNSTTYQETFRPQYHYSPPCGWMNDPNGMVYDKGQYHLFYQFDPKSMTPGPMHWGHAVSPDLMHWKTLPIALYPDDIGPIWSGSAVVDADNTSGLVPGGGLVAIYSYQDQSQGIAYSSDDGQTWTKYAGNPIIPTPGKDFRDPKVFWYDADKQWVMIISAGPEIQFWTSPDLIHWTQTGSFGHGLTPGVWEVPDMIPMDVGGQTKWLLLASVTRSAPAGDGGMRYFVGDFDGQTFSDDGSPAPLWLDYGPDNYAGTTWSGAPDNRHIYIGWMSSWPYAAATPTSPWRGATTLPRELKLVQTSEGIRLQQTVSPEFAELRTLIGMWSDVEVSGKLPLDARGRRLEIIADLKPGTAARSGLDVHQGADGQTRIVYNAEQQQLLLSRSAQTDSGTISGFTPAFGAPVPADQKTIRLHLFVDESSVEILVDDGLISISGQTFMAPGNDGIGLFAEGGSATISHLEIYEIASVWMPDNVADSVYPCP